MSEKRQGNAPLARLRRLAGLLAFVILTAAIYLFLFGSSLWATPPLSRNERSRAQLDPTVRIEPVQSTVAIGDTFTVTVMIDNADDLGAFEFWFFYDPAIVTVDDVTLGDFLGSTGRSVVSVGPEVDNEAGKVEFGAFSFGGQPGPDGSGALALVRLRAVGLGSGSLDLQDITLTDTEANSQTPTVEDGAVTVSSATTPTPTATPTPTHTPTITPTPTDTPTITPTPETVPGGIEGQAYLQGRSDHSGVTITVGGADKEGMNVADGSYAVADVPPGAYVVTVTMPCYLYARRENVTVMADTITTLPDVTLLSGDANNDGRVRLADMVIVSSNYLQSVPPGDPRADINGDGVVRLADLILVGTNYTKMAPGPWP